MDDDVERRRAEVARQAGDEPVDREITELLVTFVRADVFGGVLEDVIRRVERIDALEFQQAPVAHATGFVELSAFEQAIEDVERRRPRSDAHRGAGLRQCFRDRETVAGVVSDASNECASSREVDGEHGVIAPLRSPRASGATRGGYTYDSRDAARRRVRNMATVLYVDDDPAVRMVVRRQLEHSGLQVYTAEGVREAKERIEQMPPDGL